MDHTERTATESARPAELGHRPVLVVAFEGARPMTGGSRHSLADVSEVTIGRGDERGVLRQDKRLLVTLPDSRISAQHARLHRVGARWRVEDLGSTNGTTVDGEPITEGELPDDSRIEVGSAVLLFKRYATSAAVADEAVLGPDTREVRTLVPSFEAELERLLRIAASPVSVLLLGETGVGKEVLARLAHERSGRPGPFVAVNCGAIPANLVESQLFGHVKGAFSGAVSQNLGVVRESNGGTLFLDEVGELPAASQAALLRTLQSGEVVPVGGTRPTHVDLRVIAATHRELDQLVEADAFRRDLYARLAGFVFRIPPLRERLEDFGLLTAALLARRDVPANLRLRSEAVRLLFEHEWPMNVRELEQCLATALVLTDGDIEVEHLPEAVRGVRSKQSSQSMRALDAADRAIYDQLVLLFTEHGGNVTAVAREMGKARQQIQRWVRRFGIDPARYKQ